MKLLLLALCVAMIGCTPNTDHGDPAAKLIKIARGHEASWDKLVQAASTPPMPFTANIEFLRNEGSTVDDVIDGLPTDYVCPIVFLADEVTFSSEEQSCLVVDLVNPKRPRFRASPESLASIENNLAIGNMAFEEFEAEARRSGVFRGF